MLESSEQKRKKTKKRRVPASFLALNPYPIIEVNVNGKIFFQNSAAEAAFPDLEQIGLNHPLFVDWQNIIDTLCNQTPDLRREIQISPNWFIQQFFLVPDTNRIRMYFTPINELKQTQQILQTIMNGAKNFQLAYLDPNFCYIHVNDAYAKSCGFTPEEMVGKRLFDLYSDYPETEATFKEAIKTLTPVERKDSPLVFPNQPERGVTYWDWTLKPITDAAGQLEGLVLSMVETTERKLAQQQLEEYAIQMEQLAEQRAKELSRAERMAAIGETAGMVGHDIRNPLQAIAGELYLCKEELVNLPDCESKKNIQESLQQIEQNLFYIDKIVADLQDYTKPLIPHWEKIKVEKIIEEALLIVTVPNNLQVNIIIPPDFPALTADQAMLKRALTNLIQNAVQSMPNGGTLKIQTEHQNGAAAINISDTGTGIAPDIQPKIFSPLFTTKSKGQGFGLAVVKRLIEAQNGTVTYQTDTAKGTTFTVKLPIKQNK